MAAPVDAGRATTGITAVASPWLGVNLPASIAAGDLLVAFVCTTNGRSLTASGWTQLTGSEDQSDASALNHVVFYRVADGTEGATTDVFTPTGGTSKGTVIVWRITGARTSGTILTVALTANLGANMDPPSCGTDGGTSSDVLALAMGAVDGETQSFTAPSGYSNIQNANSGTSGVATTNGRAGGASRGLTAVTSEDPGAFTNAAPTTANGGTAYTVLVHAPSGTVDSVPTGGALVGGTSPVARVASSVGGVLSSGNTPSPRTTPPLGGVVVDGRTPSPRVPLGTTGGALVSGNPPTVLSGVVETPAPGGATVGGSSPTARVTTSPGGSTVGGVGARAVVPVSRGGATVGGFTPTDGGPSVETPVPGGAVAGGRSPLAVVATTPGGATVSGRQPTSRSTVSVGGALVGGSAPSALVIVGVGGAGGSGQPPGAIVVVGRGGVTVGGNEPSEPTLVKIVVHFDQPSPGGAFGVGRSTSGHFDGPSPSVST